VGALEVDALPGSVGGDEDQYVWVLREALLDLPSLVARSLTMNADNRFPAAKKSVQVTD